MSKLCKSQTCFKMPSVKYKLFCFFNKNKIQCESIFLQACFVYYVLIGRKLLLTIEYWRQFKKKLKFNYQAKMSKLLKYKILFIKYILKIIWHVFKNQKTMFCSVHSFNYRFVSDLWRSIFFLTFQPLANKLPASFANFFYLILKNVSLTI